MVASRWPVGPSSPISLSVIIICNYLKLQAWWTCSSVFEAPDDKNSNGKSETLPVDTSTVEAEDVNSPVVQWWLWEDDEYTHILYTGWHTLFVHICSPWSSLGRSFKTLDALRYIICLLNTPALTSSAALPSGHLFMCFSIHFCIVFQKSSNLTGTS